MKILAWLIGAVAVILTLFMLFTAGWERPPIVAEQSGFRGVGMAHISNPRVDPQRLQAQLEQVPDLAPLEPDSGGPTAGEIYQNVQVLGDLSIGRFNRVMQAMTEWIYPEEGCAGCHNLNNLADDSMYQKVVSRRMVQMTQNINSQWDSHVVETGVTCYTCHRGKNVPEYTWFNADPATQSADGMGGWRAGQNMAAAQVGLTSMPADPFTDLLEDSQQIRVVGQTALPDEMSTASIQGTEKTYALMIHMSTALDVNCTFCHNSRNFGSWETSTPQRVTSWYGIRMTQSLNVDYVAPLSSVLPDHRLGPTGEGQKVNCETCHQGVNKPLGGLAMAKDYPSLLGSGRSTALSQETVDSALASVVSQEEPDEIEAAEL